MSDEEPKELTPFQELLIESFLEFERKKGRPVSENVFARWLGISSGVWNSWKLGTRQPTYASLMKIAPKLGDRVFTTNGFPPLSVTKDPRLQYVIDHWEDYGFEEMQDIIYEHVREEVDRLAKKENNKPHTVEQN